MNGPVKKGNFNCIAGDIKLLGLRGGTINASTVSGDFSASWESIFEPTFLSAKSVSGSLRLYFPKDARIAGEINTSAGRIRTNFPGSFGNKGNSFFLQESEANVEVFASTVSGSVALLAQGDLAFAPYETMEEVETLVDEFKLHPHDPAPVAILNLYSYEKMLTPGLKFRLGDGLYATGNIEYSYRERDLNLQLGAVYSFPYDFCLLSFYGGGGVQFSTKKGIQYPYILIGANYFSFLFSELVYPWAIDTPPRSRFGLKINF